jgi:hypothetical protein
MLSWSQRMTENSNLPFQTQKHAKNTGNGQNWIAVKTIELHWRNRMKSRHQVNRIATTRIDQTKTDHVADRKFRVEKQKLGSGTFYEKCT